MARKISATDRTVASNGYILSWRPDHHLADIRGYVYEHRIVAENSIGRKLKPNEHVHHIDRNKQNNDPNNLQVLSGMAEHRFLHRKRGSILRLPNESNPIINCKCGCGRKFRKYDKTARPREYISGHNPRQSQTIDMIIESINIGKNTSRELRSLPPNKYAIQVALYKMKQAGIVKHISRGLWSLNEQMAKR